MTKAEFNTELNNIMRPVGNGAERSRILQAMKLVADYAAVGGESGNFSGDYNDLDNKPEDLSDFNNDQNFLTEVDNANWNGPDLEIQNGGTGASSAAAARANLGLEIGVDVADQGHNHDAAYSAIGHNHAGVYEPVFAKNSAHNKNFGANAGDVAEGNHNHDAAYSSLVHNHDGVYEPVFAKNSAHNKDFGTNAGDTAEGNHTHAGLLAAVAPIYVPAFDPTDEYAEYRTKLNQWRDHLIDLGILKSTA